MKRIAGLLLIMVLFSCSADRPDRRDVFRIGIPARDMRLFKGGDISPIAGFNMIVLKPEEKARNLEVLLFSTHSGAFDCVVVPASTAPILGKWADPFPAPWASEIKDEVIKPYLTDGGIYALPMTLDFPVFIYREDVFRDGPMPQPQNLGLLRESLKKLSGKKGNGLISTLQEELLFISLLSSEEGQIPSRFYSSGAVRLLNFFKEFDLRKATVIEAEAGIQKREVAAAFVMLSEAGKIVKESQDKGVFLKIAPLPRTSRSYSVFDGLCLMGYGFNRKNLKVLHSFIDEPFQSGLASMGYAPVIKKDYQLGVLQDAVASTNVIRNPFRWEECAILRESLLDALEGGQDAESALIRAEARLNNMKEK